ESDLINCDRMVNMYGFPYIYLPIPPGGFGSLPINGEEHFVKCNFKYTGTYVPYSGNNTVAKTYSQLAIVFNMQNGQGVNILGSNFQNAYYPISNVDTLPRAINALFSQFTVSN